ncbi:MAG: adenylate/guanylate cyclase domain-containing protein [bacterium]
MKKFSPVIIVGLLLTLFCAGLHFYEPEFISAISLKTYDAYMRIARVPPKADRVVLIDIDEESLARYGQFPWPRYLLADLTRKVLDGKASVLAFDITFAEPDGQSPNILKANLNSRFNLDIKLNGIPDNLMDFDSLFAGALSKAKKRTILGCFMYPATNMTENVVEVDPHYRQHFYTKADNNTGKISDFLMKSSKMTISIPRLSEAAGNNGFFNSFPDADNVVRRIPLFIAYGANRFYPSLAVEAVRIDMGIDKIGIECGFQGVERLRLKDAVIPTDRHGRMLVNFRSFAISGEEKGIRSFPSSPAWKVLSSDFDTKWFSNKIVFVGTSAAGLNDRRATPLATEKEAEIAGVEVHAAIVDNIVSGDVLYQPEWHMWVDLATIILMGVFLTILIDRGKALLSFVAMVLVLGLVLGVSYWLFQSVHFVFIPVKLFASTIIIYPVLTMIRFWQEERQKRHVRNMFGTMVSTEVLRYLENNPESFSLTGFKAEATMFFSDIAGFTTISESLQPGRLSELLNQYLSPTTKIIMARNGYVDKYEGDLIMAEWGVPFATDDHAVQACLAAIEQQALLDELRPVLKQEFGHEVHVRMGINTGTVTAGNMGSDNRFQYTVIGDAVNLARRLEPANKDYDTRTIIGESTFERARSAIEARLLDKIVVKGKSKPVLIYELLGKKGEVSEQVLRTAKLYEEALALYFNQKWAESIACLEGILGENPADGPSATLLQRAKEFLRTAPGRDWSGAYRREDKE